MSAVDPLGPLLGRQGALSRRGRRIAMTAALLAVLGALLILEVSLGDSWIPPGEVVRAVLGAGDTSPSTRFLVVELRGPRAAAAVVVGACLGLSGGITQSVLRNPLASPDIMGVTAGASLLAVAALLSTGATRALTGGSSPVAVPVAACTGGALAGCLVVVLAWRGGIDSRRVVLVGLGVNAGLSSVTSWLLLRADLPDLGAATVWMTGSLAGVDAETLRSTVPGSLVCLVLAALSSRTLGLLRFGQVTVRSLGVNVPRAALGQAALAVVAAALACSIGGPIAFVAFCAPQVAMVAFGTEGPPPAAAALVGAVLLVGADVVARVALPMPVPVGLVTSCAGAPVFLWLLTRYAGRGA